MKCSVALQWLLAFVLVISGGSSVSAEEQREELERLRVSIEEKRQKVGEHERRERQLLEELEGVDRVLIRFREERSEAWSQAQQARVALAATEEPIATLQAQVETYQRRLTTRARALYKMGAEGPLRFLFSAGSLPERLSRVSALRALVAHDENLVALYRENQQALEASTRTARVAAGEHDSAVAELRERTQNLSNEQAKKLQILARVRGDRSRERSLLIEMEVAARALEETLRNLARAPTQRSPGPTGLAFGSRKGLLQPPVDAQLSQGFGRVVDTRFQTQTFSRGVEFAAPLGAPVRAVAMGEVRYSGWFRGYGRIVILDHGDGFFTVSGHLERVDVDLGQWVNEGAPIGVVGETGSLDGPSLYFEIREAGEPVDPSEWLTVRGEG